MYSMGSVRRKWYFALIGSAFLMGGCGAQELADNSAERNNTEMHPMDVERNEMETDLLTLRNRIDVRLDELDAQLQNGSSMSDSDQAHLMRTRDEWQDARNRVERARRDVDASRYDNWPNVRKSTMATFNEISEWIDGRASVTDTVPQGLRTDPQE